MEGEQFSLCWNNFHNNLSSGFHTLLQDEDLVDVTLAAEGRYLKAHKTVLSVCSPYFKELFRVNPCKHPIVILHDVNYSALQNLLQFMYQGEVSVSQDEIPTFMRIAEMLKVKGLTDHARSGTNGFDSFKEAFEMSEDRQFAKRKPVMTKRVIKPAQHLRPLEPPPLTLKSPTHPRSSPASIRRSSPPPQPVAKQPRLDSSLAGDSSSSTPITPKEEPLDHDDEFDDAYEDSSLDMSMMLDTTLGESSEAKSNCFVGSSKHPDTSSPGTLQCILGRRGNPRLIVDGHTFFKKSSYKSKCFWYCKFNRNHQYRCQATCWTRDGLIVKWPTGHSHEVVPERFNPDEDTMVPIERFREVLIQAAQNY